VQLRALAHVRSGDKGGISDLTVVAHDEAAYAVLDERLTADAVRHWFDDLPVTRVERHELPRLRALKFVLHDALGGGVTATLALDAHGKCLSSCLLAFELDDRDSSESDMSEPKIDLGRGGPKQ
jgi:hypothetical protein